MNKNYDSFIIPHRPGIGKTFTAVAHLDRYINQKCTSDENIRSIDDDFKQFLREEKNFLESIFTAEELSLYYE